MQPAEGDAERGHHRCHPYQGWIILHFIMNQGWGGSRGVVHRNRLTIAVTLTKVGSFYTLNKWEGGYIGIISSLLSPLSRLDHSVLLDEFGVGYIGITSPSLSPLSRLDHFTLLNESDGGGEVYQNYCSCQSVCLSVYSNWISL